MQLRLRLWLEWVLEIGSGLGVSGQGWSRRRPPRHTRWASAARRRLLAAAPRLAATRQARRAARSKKVPSAAAARLVRVRDRVRVNPKGWGQGQG